MSTFAWGLPSEDLCWLEDSSHLGPMPGCIRGQPNLRPRMQCFWLWPWCFACTKRYHGCFLVYRVWCLLSKTITSLSSNCLLSWKHRRLLAALVTPALIAYHKPNILVARLCQRSRRAGDNILQRFIFTWLCRPGRKCVADPLSRNPAFRHIVAFNAYVLHAMLNVTARSQSAATQPAPPTQVTRSTSSAPIALPPSSPSALDPGSDTVISDASQTILDLLQGLVRGHGNDAFLANNANLQDLQMYEK